MSEPQRSRRARALAEAALVRIVTAYGETPEFVVLGGLVPDLLCSKALRQHVGTADIDVQVDLEIQAGARNAARLERALQRAQFTPSGQYVWRWQDRSVPGAVVKIELLADLATAPAEATVTFTGSQSLGAVNLRGTGFAAPGLAASPTDGRHQWRTDRSRGPRSDLAGLPAGEDSRGIRSPLAERLLRRGVRSPAQRRRRPGPSGGASAAGVCP